MWSAIASHLSEVTGVSLGTIAQRSVGGGCINQAYCLTVGEQPFFVKLNRAETVSMFEAEAIGLKQLWDSHTIRVPKPLCWGICDRSAYLVLEWIDLGSGSRSASFQMGQQLATLHRVTSAQGFGWDQNNTIGSTPQINTWSSTWLSFFGQHRLSYQFKLARRNGGSFPQQDQLLDTLPQLLDHNPQPALVHGDLWGGNASFTRSGEPLIFDPATYFGDREVDIAMTELFGGFPSDFYQGYNAAFPLDDGYPRRKILYNLYHILNHFNLFGGSYESQANRMIQQILR
jgi:fructosamine-3-kinase